MQAGCLDAQISAHSSGSACSMSIAADQGHPVPLIGEHGLRLVDPSITAFARKPGTKRGAASSGQAIAWMPSRPGEFHPEPLTDPDLNLSIHPARVTARRLPPSR